MENQKQKGEQVGIMQHYVLRYTDEKDHNIVSTVRVTGVELEPREEYIVDIISHNGRNGVETVATTEIKTGENAETVTLPKQTLEETGGLQPGKTVSLEFYEVKTEEPEPDTDPISDSSEIIGRAEVVGNVNSSDGCDSAVYCDPAVQYVGEGKEMLRFRNTRNQLETECVVHADYNKGNRVQFPYHARRDVEAKKGDLIEIIEPGEKGNQTDVEERIREMHSMMMDLYNEHLEEKND